jgi:hypothetical protein
MHSPDFAQLTMVSRGPQSDDSKYNLQAAVVNTTATNTLAIIMTRSGNLQRIIIIVINII